MTKTNLAITSAIILGILVVISLVLPYNSVTPEAAQKACDAFTQDVKAKISSVPGYKIVKEYPRSCNGSTDEASAMDYTMSVAYRVSKVPDSTDATIRNDIDAFVAKLPHNNYGIHVENAAPIHQPLQLCIFASRYLNNDGKYIPQGSTENSGRYIEQSEFARGYRGCR